MNNPGIFKIVLGAENQKLSAQRFKKLYSIMYSDKGSNDRDKEDKTIYCLDLYLQDLEEEEVNGVTLEDLLIFTTGADTVPPLGFDGPILIEFYETEEKVKRYPWSSTCSLTLFLPRGIEDPKEFNSLLTHALEKWSWLWQMLKNIKFYYYLHQYFT